MTFRAGTVHGRNASLWGSRCSVPFLHACTSDRSDTILLSSLCLPLSSPHAPPPDMSCLGGTCLQGGQNAMGVCLYIPVKKSGRKQTAINDLYQGGCGGVPPKQSHEICVQYEVYQATEPPDISNCWRSTKAGMIKPTNTPDCVKKSSNFKVRIAKESKRIQGYPKETILTQRAQFENPAVPHCRLIRVRCISAWFSVLKFMWKI